ncbi:MAG: tRNA glutamyl-Q(34) synthetase GluQRS [Aestuariivita sp.]|nr:tRNA glutamyl-Q(34) synthetase GluQRS [Aestuariivita sp.]MCY4203811.1 tRNA glutamyl-Q(34) synthetase GluQRS [Aestuariivita sp.]
MTFVTRFAPSPTGLLHLGHAYSALLAHDMARHRNGKFLLRLEDIDQQRCHQKWEECIFEDLTWLGIKWDEPVRRQSRNLKSYQDALQDLWERSLLYPCRCSRHDILSALSAPHTSNASFGPDGPVYPGTCRPNDDKQLGLIPDDNVALRLNVAKSATGKEFNFVECRHNADGVKREIPVLGGDLIANVGDFVVSRRGYLGSYHLCVVLDDAAQRITDVIRGQDLFSATKIHVLLQYLFDLPTPVYHHHTLITDKDGKRLAKRDDARAISLYREAGASPDDIRELVGLTD